MFSWRRQPILLDTILYLYTICALQFSQLHAIHFLLRLHLLMYWSGHLRVALLGSYHCLGHRVMSLVFPFCETNLPVHPLWVTHRCQPHHHVVMVILSGRRGWYSLTGCQRLYVVVLGFVLHLY